MNGAIKCPKCGNEIPLTDALEHRIDEQLHARLRDEIDLREAGHAEALREREAELRKEFAAQQEAREADARERAERKAATEVADLQNRVKEQEETLQRAHQFELEFLKQKRKLDEERAALDLEVARRVDTERDQIAAQIAERLNEDHRLKQAQKDLQLEQMKKQIKELQESSEQVPPGLRGEVLERDIEDVLRERFPADSIDPIKAGVRGADVLQLVRSTHGRDCGLILWESKRAKTWSNGWIAKLKQDQVAQKADVAVVVSPVLPANVRHMEWYEGVWIVDTACVAALATALREGLVQVAHSRAIDANRNQALDSLYAYLSGPDFRQRIVTAVETFVEMQKDLDCEKRATLRAWAKRLRQLELIAFNTAGMYGELEAIMGGALAPVELLELPPAA